MNVYPKIAPIASLLADPTRAAMLDALLDGRALPASELAYMARVKAQTASSHLAKLVEGNLLVVENQGRHRYYRLAGSHVAHVLETLASIAPPVQVRSLRQSDHLQHVRFARTCYDHLAGKVGVEVTQSLLSQGLLDFNGKEYELTEEGTRWVKDFGIPEEALRQKRRVFARPCLDWSERRHHISGVFGTALTSHFFHLEWMEKMPNSRAVEITDVGKANFSKVFGITFDA